MDVRRSYRSPFVGALALVAMLSTLAGTAGALQTPAPGGVTVQIATGIGGYIDPESPLAVVVDISSPQLLVGRVEVRASRRTATEDIEVPAGSTKRYTLQIGALGRSRQLTVAVFDENQTNALLSENVRLQVPRDQILVAVAGVANIDSTLRSALSTPVGREVTPVGVDLATAVGSLSVAPYVVVGPGQLASLDTDALDELGVWVRKGGRIIGPEADLATFGAPLGEALAGAPALAAPLGSGEVISVADVARLDAEAWSAILRDVAPKGLVFDQASENSGASLLSAASAGREASVPALPWLLLGILLFVVLVGPINFVVLRWMGKPEWAWFTVPMLSFVFVGAFWFVGRSQLSDFTVDQASVVVDEYGTARASTALVLQTAKSGTHTMELPEGWQPEPFESLGLQTADSTSTSGGRTVYSFEMDDLGVGVAQAAVRPEGVDVEVELRADGSAFTGTVTNNTDAEFTAWGVVLMGRASSGEGSLAPGATAEITVRSPRAGFTSYEPVIATGVSRSISSINDQSAYTKIDALARQAEAMAGDLRDSGAYFFGFTDDLQPSVVVDGRQGSATGTTLAVRRFELDDSVVAAIGRVRPELVSVLGASSLESWYGEIYAYGADEIVLAYRLPAGVPSTGKIATTSRQFSVVEAYDWSAGEFRRIDWNSDFSLPAFTSVTGDLVVRASVDPEREGEFFGDESIVLDRYSLTWSVS